MTGYTYILECSDGTYYVGSTKEDLSLRLEQHAAGFGAAYTARRRPPSLLWHAGFERIEEALALEKRLQGWSHAKRAAFIHGGFDAVRHWSARTRVRGGR